MKKIRCGHLVLLSVFSMSSAAIAVEFQSPRTLSLGGAGRGAPLLNDTIYLNPSFGSYTPIYSLSGAYTSFDGGRNYNVSVQDSRNELFQAGVGFTKREQNNVINVGASKSFDKRLGIGVGTKILLDQPGNHMTTDLLVSASYIALPWMYASIIADNLIASAEQTARNLTRTVYLATKLIPSRKVEVFLDPFYSPAYSNGRKAGYHAGLELGMLEDFYLRLGKFQDAEVPHLNTRGTGFGVGVGWLGPKLNLEYAQSRTTSTHAGDTLNSAHSVSMTVFF